MTVKSKYMNTWMVPKNKRRLLYLIDAFPLFVSNITGGQWKGDRSTQRKFEEALEAAGLKKEGMPYDSNSGGARTYASQMICVGLLFYDTNSKPAQYRPTLAGEAILNGKDPLAILQNQLLKLQYPSVYSTSSNVNINPEFRIHPFLFMLRLLLDQEMGYLTKQEIGRFLLAYARNDNDFTEIKKRILAYRSNPDDALLPDSFMNNTSSPRAKSHNFKERIIYLEDKANIFINYLESVQLIVRPDSKTKIEINDQYSGMVQGVIDKMLILSADLSNPVSVQRKFGLDLEKKKDTRAFTSGAVSEDAIKESLVKSRFFVLARTELVLGLDESLLSRLERETAVSSAEIVKILDQLPANGLAYFEEKYLEMSQNGTEECIDFEKATKEIFEKELRYIAKHIGQIRPARRGGNPDVIFIARSKAYCGLVDTKAYKRYQLNNDHKNRMLQDYIPNYREHAEGAPLKVLVYVSGGFAKTFKKNLSDLAKEGGVPGSSITARNLLRLARKNRTKVINHNRLLETFSERTEVDALTIDNL